MKKFEATFISTVNDFYTHHGRHQLPWRKTKNPYRILVSEIMLQQTQVDRVIPKYTAFLKRFPNVETLAGAPLSDVVRMWQGLGYNRRAKMLHECSKMIVDEYHGRWPQEYRELISLPGVGPYTAGAIMAFAFNQPQVLIETNVRTVYLHHYFPNQDSVPDSSLLPIIERTLDRENPRVWYAALMDYGSHLKRTIGNVSTRSLHHTRQAPFKGSDREIRGAIIKSLTTAAVTKSTLLRILAHFDDVRVMAQVHKLQDEGLVTVVNRRYTLPT